MISNPAKLLRAVMRLMGVTDTRQLAAELDIPLRTIQRLKLECATDGADASSAKDAINGVDSANSAISGAKPDAKDAISGACGARNPSRACATKESPSEIVISRVSQLASSAPAHADEIEGLNGSTPRLVDQLARWLCGPLSVPDHEAARDILVGCVESYGPEKVRAGMLELQTLIASGERPRNLPKAFAGYIKGAKLAPAGAQAVAPKRTLAQALADKRARENGVAA